MSSGAGAGVTFLGTGAGVKKVTPITSGCPMLHFKDQVSLTCTEVYLRLRFLLLIGGSAGHNILTFYRGLM